jgi:hypothetical protein
VQRALHPWLQSAEGYSPLAAECRGLFTPGCRVMQRAIHPWLQSAEGSSPLATECRGLFTPGYRV